MRITKAFFLIMCLSICTKAQVSPLQKSLVKIIKIDENLFKSNSNFNNKNFIVFIGISVNKFGLVDTVIYNKRDLTHEKDQLRQLINFESIATVIKQNKKDFKPYKNEFLVLMIYLRRGDDDVVTNPDDLERNLSNLIKETNKIKNKKLILLPPWIYSFDTKRINN